MSNNNVIFKGNKDGIVIILDDTISFEELVESLKKKTIIAKDFFGESKSAVMFKGRELSDEQEMKLLNTISETSGFNISFVIGSNRYKRKIPIINKVEEPFNIKEHPTHFYTGSLRSGMSIKFNGSVIIKGDVNPGGEVIAEGNVIVLGTLKGVVHAGKGGSKDAFVAALNMKPTQLRIADLITYFPEDTQKRPAPECAYVNDNKIFVKFMERL